MTNVSQLSTGLKIPKQTPEFSHDPSRVFFSEQRVEQNSGEGKCNEQTARCNQGLIPSCLPMEVSAVAKNRSGE
jgi:hypothetical protein